MAGGRSKNQAQHEAAGMMRWLLTYSDMITLLLAFFVVLYSMAKIDQTKYQLMASSLRLVFKGSPSVLDAGGAPTPVNISESASIRALAAQLSAYLREHQLANRVQLEVRPDRLLLRMPDTLLFESGEATLTPQAEKTLTEIGHILAAVGKAVAVEGFTDNVPIHNALYPSNRHLSAARAATVLVHLIVHGGLSPANSVAEGFGEQHPVAPNDTPEHRALNRRVELVVYDSATIWP